MSEFDLSLHNTLPSASESHLIYSPFSTLIAMCMLALGASSDTLRQIQSVCQCNHAQNEDAIESLMVHSTIVNVTNAIFPMEGFRLKHEFERDLKRYYYAVAKSQDYVREPERSRLNINAHVKECTKGLIPQLLPPNSISSLTRNVLVNTIFFLGTWRKQFDPELTKPMQFATVTGSSAEVQMMTHRSLGRLQWIEYGNNVIGLRLPFSIAGFTMEFVKPAKANDAKSLQAAEELVLKGEDSTVHEAEFALVQIPKFTMSKSLDLTSSFQELGIRDAFSPDSADFSRMFANSDEKLSVTAIFHQAKIVVNEKGAEAAAATAVVVNTRAPLLPERHEFVLDRSFLARISYMGETLFVARVIEPKTEE